MTQQAAHGPLEQAQLETLHRGIELMALKALGHPHAAEDVAQETLARVIRAQRDGRLEGVNNLGAFVRGIARHVIADAYRDRHRQPSLHSDPDDSPPDKQLDALSLLITKEETETAVAALERLQESDREILRLCYLEGLSAVEASERLGEPYARVRKRKSRALGKLRRLLEVTHAEPVGPNLRLTAT